LHGIHTIHGYAIPLDVWNGLPYMQLHPYTDTEWEEIPHVVLTGDISWYPAVYDSVLIEDNTLYDAIADFTHDDISYDVFDQFGIFKPRPVNSAHITNKTELISNELHAFQMEINQQILDPSLYRNNFLQVPTETIKCTFEASEVAGHFVCFSESLRYMLL